MWRALQGKQFFPRVLRRGIFILFFHKNLSITKYEFQLIMNSPVIKYSQIVMPQDANVLGTLFGGQMVSWMDIAAAKAVHRFLKEPQLMLH